MAEHNAENDAPKRATWRDLLEPWANRYADRCESTDEHVAGLDDAALNALGRAALRPTQTNVWWASYNVAPLVREAVRREQYARHLAKQASVFPPGEGNADA
jgi:hypothetical protein